MQKNDKGIALCIFICNTLSSYKQDTKKEDMQKLINIVLFTGLAVGFGYFAAVALTGF